MVLTQNALALSHYRIFFALCFCFVFLINASSTFFISGLSCWIVYIILRTLKGKHCQNF